MARQLDGRVPKQVFFIRDGAKFPDLMHAFLPSPVNGLFHAWRTADILGHLPEAMHMVRQSHGIPAEPALCWMRAPCCSARRDIGKACSTAQTSGVRYQSLSAHTLQVICLFDDLGIPSSYRHMDSHAISTFTLVNAAGNATYVRFHWLTQQGAHECDGNIVCRLLAHSLGCGLRCMFVGGCGC